MPKKPRSPKRQRVVPRGTGPVTSRNRPVAGSEYSQNNAANSLIYEPRSSGNVYNRYFAGIRPSHLSFLIYDNPTRDPNDYTPTVYGITIPELLEGGRQVPPEHFYRTTVKKNVKFTDGRKHDVIAVKYNGKLHKVKFTGNNSGQNGNYPFFYIENYNNGEIEKLYGDFANRGGTPPSSQDQFEFGKARKKRTTVGNEIKYLLTHLK